MLPKPFLSVLAFLVVLPSLAHGQVSFPNGEAWVMVEDMSVKVLGGAETRTTTAAGADETHERAVANVQTETKTLRALNLEVTNAHTFFVGKDGVPVHNIRKKECLLGGGQNRAQKWLDTLVDPNTIVRRSNGTLTGKTVAGNNISLHTATSNNRVGYPTVTITRPGQMQNAYRF